MKCVFLETTGRREETEKKGERESKEGEIKTGREATHRETETGQAQGHAVVREDERTR